VQQTEGGKVMNTAIGSLTLALTLIVAPAATQSTSAAAEGPRLVPPPEYDRPFAANVIVITARDQKHVRELCPKAVFTGAALGCASLTPSWDCKIVVAADDVIKAAGYPPELVRRHEIAHCNGWPADHRGALPAEEWAVTDVASQFDNFARSVVGKTVSEVADSLAQLVLPFAPAGPRLAAQFVIAAKGIGLVPKSKITSQVLSNPVTARPLAKAVGIGTDLSDDEWRRLHAIAFQASKARQAENAAAASQSVPNLGQAAPQPQQAQPPPSGAAPR
jgi:hypothetical protein